MDRRPTSPRARAGDQGAAGTSYYPYGVYCGACGDDITHPTGYGWCFVEGGGREHRSAMPAGWKPDESPAEKRDREWEEARAKENPRD